MTLAAGSRPVLQAVPDPVAAADEVVVRVGAVGLCGSDIKVMSGVIPSVRFPVIQGHEVAGVVVQGAGGVEVGTHVGVYIMQSCGKCRWCSSGQENICPETTRMGFERNGGLAEYVVARAANVVTIPESLSLDLAAVTMDAVLTPWRALHGKGQVSAGDRVLIVGAGGLGLHAVQIAVAAGATVAITDLDDRRLEAARRLGAEVAVDPGRRDELAAWAGTGVDIALEASGAPAGFHVAADMVRPGGTIVTCGYRPGAELAFDSMRLAMAEITIRGSRGGSLADARAALAAVERKEIQPLIAGAGTLDDAPDFFAQLASGDAAGRLIVRP